MNDSLRLLRDLAQLWINTNNIGSAGAAVLAKALTANRTLTEVSCALMFRTGPCPAIGLASTYGETHKSCYSEFMIPESRERVVLLSRTKPIFSVGFSAAASVS